jgi:uncharacterized repeat protein (TIGR04138 family)
MPSSSNGSMPKNLEDKLRKVVEGDGRFHVNAYRFVYEALEFTLKSLDRKGHVTGRELLEGIRDCALEQFGGLAPMVFENWGVRKTADFGSIVFNLVEANLMGRSESDTLADFTDVYDFREAFRIDAQPRPGRRSEE